VCMLASVADAAKAIPLFHKCSLQCLLPHILTFLSLMKLVSSVTVITFRCCLTCLFSS